MTHSAPELYIGLMSGTSMDGIDAVLVEMTHSDNSNDKYRLLASHQHALPPLLAKKLNTLCQSSEHEIDLMMSATYDIASVFSQAVQELLNKAGLAKTQIKAIASHGQTIRHLPPTSNNQSAQAGFSLQIGHPAYIAAQTGIDVIGDFRVMDMAMGGHGAPLVPAFHQNAFHSPKVNRAIVNIGGIANISWLPASSDSPVIGFDTGPGNTLLDYWFKQHNSGNYDKNGNWGASGQVQTSLLDIMLKEPYLSQPYPKSTGRERFNASWLNKQMAAHPYRAQDVQATLCRFSALSIAQSLTLLAKSDHFEVYLCGGGVHNKLLFKELQMALPKTVIASTQNLGLDPDWVEAVAFAWLAKRHLHKQSGNLPAVTGAKQSVILGAYYPKA